MGSPYLEDTLDALYRIAIYTIQLNKSIPIELIVSQWKEVFVLEISNLSTPMLRWCAPPQGFELNFDGSSRGNLGPLGIGGIRDRNGQAMLTFNGPLGIYNSSYAEVLM
jgi:hypothetical protein